ncbi:hypothetical protein MRX96_004202 [Rhipicephalus microplus]
MSLEKSHFTGCSKIDKTSCTGSEGRLCHIFEQISLWNEYFCQVHLELRELSPGHLSLVETEYVCVGECANYQEIHLVTTLLHHLLTRHHCLRSVDVVPSVFLQHHELMCDALCKSLSLAKLKLSDLHMATQSLRKIATVLLHLNHLRELEFEDMTFNRDFTDGLSEFLASTRSLTALAVTHVYFICDEDAVAFLEGLGRNHTITTLTLDTIVLRTGQFNDMIVSPRSAAILFDYLRGNRTLRTLSIGGRYVEHFNKDIELITRLPSQNRTLTRVNVTKCAVRGASSLAAFTENKTLEELTLDLSTFHTNEYNSLFRALASNPWLKKVNVELFKQEDVSEICRAIRETGVQECFFVGTHYVLENTAGTVRECKELSSVAVDTVMFERYEAVIATLSLLSTCSHVTSLCLSLRPDQFKGKMLSLIAQCITDMTKLTTLELLITGAGIGDAFNEGRRELAQVLSTNKSIRRLKLHGPCFSKTETEMLADTWQSSGTLCELFFFPHYIERVITLMRKLSPNISNNYTLLDMRVYPLPLPSSD